jgi:hypothetical protein
VRLIDNPPLPHTAGYRISRDKSPCPTPPEIAPPLRTFAIICPDAGKDDADLKKFLLYGGAIQMAGRVRLGRSTALAL